MSLRRPAPEGIRITRFGAAYIAATLVVGVTATNTGNNALYLVLAVQLGILVASGLVSWRNLTALELRLEPPGEVFAGRPASLGIVVRNASRWSPRWLVLAAVERGGPAMLIPFLPRGGVGRGRLDLLLKKRGRHRFRAVHVASLFPVGLFRKGLRYDAGLEVLVFPELFEAAPETGAEARRAGEHATRRAGWGHDLHALRAFRPGDDPRAIHWKQTARTGRLIYKEREAEDNRRLTILLDNAILDPADPAAAPRRAERFERLVSEAATAATDFLARGLEVELLTRESWVPSGRGPRQRLQVLETLALLEAKPLAERPLAGGQPGGRRLVLTLEAA